MDGWKTGRNGWGKLLPVATAAAALAGFGAGAIAGMSELDAFQNAVTTQGRPEALAFVDEFGSSHLIPDLIELLRPEVASQVCTRLGRGSARTRAGCDRVERALAAASAETSPATPRPAPTAAEAKAATAAPAASADAAPPAPARAKVAAPAAAIAKTARASQPPLPSVQPKATASAAALRAPPASVATAAPAAAIAKTARSSQPPLPPVQPKATASAAALRAPPASVASAAPLSPAFVILPGPEFQMVEDPAPATLGTSSGGPVRQPDDGLNVASAATGGDVERRHR